jgi:hypothetical protein
LPASPLPVPQAAGDEPANVAVEHASGRGVKRRVLFVVSLAGVVLLAAYLAVRPFVSSRRPQALPVVVDELAAFHRHVDSGRLALGGGNFQSAVEEFDSARAIWDRRRNQLTLTTGKELDQLHRQAALLADLLTDSLEEIGARIDSLEPRESEATFAKRYRGKSVIFYTTARRDPAGRITMHYRLAGGRHQVRLELSDLKLLQRLPLQQPQLLLFGVRLAGVRREPDGSLLISLDPDSGVLITDPGAAEACCFQPPDEAQFRSTLERQASWLSVFDP